jgi:hypothetical protein
MKRALVFLTTIFACMVLARLAIRWSVFGDVDTSRRTSMALIGVLFVFFGNAMPKQLTPLSQLSCSGARIQAFQRFSGWTWVLTGLTYAAIWLLAPMTMAKPLSMLVMACGMTAIVVKLVGLWRASDAPA